MLQRIEGRVVRIALDNVNTDVIAPSLYRTAVPDGDKNLTPLRTHVMEAIRPGLDEFVRPGDVFVTGKNYGCGSHREPAVQIFKVWGVQAVVVETAGRLWFRNAIAAGLPVFELKDATRLFDESDRIEIDLKNWRITNLTRKGEAHPVQPFPDTVMRILEIGGIMPLLKQRIDARLAMRTNDE
jgi:3-isopropylmalate/(R)-2-methylmalate dehydratase small subunit